jgi:hypothetical protein
MEEVYKRVWIGWSVTSGMGRTEDEVKGCCGCGQRDKVHMRWGLDIKAEEQNPGVHDTGSHDVTYTRQME